ncbi:DUF4012 domain-containing protein [Candidatus Microgenomates bacterium]|nr:DUF4012 domain-containing protein [Candidatus Microgenomates bacterium]
MERSQNNLQNPVDNGDGKRSGVIKNLEGDSQYDINWGRGDGKTQEPMKRKKAVKNNRERNKRLKVIGGFVAFAIVFSYLFIIRPAQAIKSDLKSVSAKAKELKSTFAANDLDAVESKFKEFSTTYAKLEKDSKNIYWLSFVPYVADYKNGIEAGRYTIAAGQEGITAVAPYADLIGFSKGKSSFSEKSGEDRLQTAVLTLDKILGRLDSISANINQAEIRINKIDPNRYPEKFGKTPVRAQVANIKEQFAGVASLFVDAKPLIKNLPKIMGKDKEQTYLILFQNNNELRATGGFLTSYAFFRIKDGKMKIENSSDIYSLDGSIANHPPAPQEILTYHKGVSQFYIRDSNLSPDLPTSLKLFEGLYEKSNVKVQYDGVIMLDSKILVDMLKIYGDTEVDGVRFSANEDARCDCPQVIYTLFDLVDRPVNYIKENRKGILGDLMFQLFNKALGFSPSKYWGILAQTMYGNLQEKHILLNFKDPQIQAAAEGVGFAGRIRPYDGDYLHISNVNFAGAKSNLFVQEAVTTKTTSKNGRIEKEVTITFKNPYPQSDCNLEHGNLCLNAPLRNWIRFFVPKGSTLTSLTGAARQTKTYDDLGKTVYENFLVINPMGSAKVVATYTLPDTIKSSKYTYMIQKQPGIEKDKQSLEVIVGGKSLYKGPFDTDKTFKNAL